MGLFLAGSASGGEGVPAELTVTKNLSPGTSISIEALMLTRNTVYEFNTGEKIVLVRVTPDGFMQFVETGARTTVTVRGKKNNRVSFDLQAGERVSVWPVAVLRISCDAADRISVDASSAGWAFVGRAEEVRQGGLPTLVDGNAATLTRGQRLDADVRKKGGPVTFRQTAQTWPGRSVTMPAVAEHVREVAAPTVVVLAEPSLPGVILDRGREYPWQTIPLPVIGIEPFIPADVSP
jgi:hypothetical protein